MITLYTIIAYVLLAPGGIKIGYSTSEVPSLCEKAKEVKGSEIIRVSQNPSPFMYAEGGVPPPITTVEVVNCVDIPDQKTESVKTRHWEIR